MKNENEAIEKIDNLIEGLTALKEFLSEEPELNLCPYSIHYTLYASDKDEFSRLAATLVGGAGSIEKKYDNYSCSVTRKFSEHVEVSVNIEREQVCEKIVVGKKIVPSYYSPEHEEEVVEWKCK